MTFIRGMLVATLVLAFGCGDDGGGDTADAATGSIDAAGGSIDATNGGPDAAPVSYGDLSVAMSDMAAHTTQLMEFRVVSDGDVLVARGLLDTLLPEGVNDEFTFLMPDSVPDDTDYRVDFYADLSMDRMYTTPPADHAWRLPIPSNGQVVFPHGVNFQDLDIPAITEAEDFQLNLSDMSSHDGQLIEVRVINTDSGQAVGHYRITALATSDFSLPIPGIIEDGANYQVDFYADVNDNDMYDAPPIDNAWRRTGVGTSSGLTITFARDDTFTDIEF